MKLRKFKKQISQRKHMLLFSSLVAAVGTILLLYSHAATLIITPQLVASGYSDPVDIANTNVAGDNRLFVVERRGVIRILKTDGSKVTTPFLDISSKVLSSDPDSEEGMLGLTFHPQYTSNRYFYVTYVKSDRSLNISRFTRNATNPDVADASSELVLLNVPHAEYTNHNGGSIHFGPDGYLYISTGDGGNGNDSLKRAQDKNNLSGKMLRLDVNAASPYIPASNPYAGATAGRDEIWAIGLRNPWRFSFDRSTGDMWIGDVGQSSWEEVNFQPAGASTGGNYGWSCYEGNAAMHAGDSTYQCTGTQSSYTAPVAAVDHGNFRCAMVGGYRYRGTQYPAMSGRYFFGDYCSTEIFSLVPNGTGGWSQELLADTGINFSSFGEDTTGEIYMADLNGDIYHLATPTQPADSQAPTASITSPANGTTQSNTITIQAAASDNVGVTKVEFLIDNAPKGSTATAPYTYNLDTNTLANGTHTIIARAYDAAGNTGTSSTVTFTAANTAPNPLPTPWKDGDIGVVGTWGSASANGGTFTVKGAGADIGGANDAFHYVYQPLSGDGQITTRIASMGNTDPNAKAGLMIRDNLGSNAVNVSLLATPTASGGLVFETRSSVSGGTTITNAVPNITAPYWLRLQRQVGTVSAAWSTDGVNWEHIATVSVTLSVNTTVGFAVSSHNPATLNTAVFDNINVLSGGNTPPLIDITYPAHSGIYGGLVTVTTTVSDSDGINRVEFRIDGSATPNGTDTTAPYTYDWNTQSLTNGSHTLEARAYDALGNYSIHTHIVNIQNALPGTVLLGDQTIEAQSDSIALQQIEAWPYTPVAEGAASSAALYLASNSTAQTVLVGLYNDASGSPGSLLASATISQPQAGAWNTAVFSAQPYISTTKPDGSPNTYWIGVLGSGSGQVWVADRSGGSCAAKTSNGVSALPANFSSISGTYTDCPLSAYVVSAAGSSNPIVGDLDADNHVTAHDLSLLLSKYGTTYAAYDLDNTPPITGHDLSLLLANFGK